MVLQYEYPDLDRYTSRLHILNSEFHIVSTVKSDTQKISYKIIDNNGRFYFCKIKLLDCINSDDQLYICDILSKYRHENINFIYRYDVIDGFFIVISEYIEGRCLKIDTNIDQNTDIIEGLLNGIKFLHDQNIIHGDLKFNNIIVSNDTLPVIIDFDLSRRETYGNICDGLYGTKFFIPPETVNECIYTKKMDMWALGVILYMVMMHETSSNSNYFFTVIENPVCDKKWRFSKLIKKLLNKDYKTRLNIDDAITIFNESKNKYEENEV